MFLLVMLVLVVIEAQQTLCHLCRTQLCVNFLIDPHFPATSPFAHSQSSMNSPLHSLQGSMAWARVSTLSSSSSSCQRSLGEQAPA
jgi:hypothetical protein